jgi:Tfp pilus assembly pilus retraction ATPase PilT
MTNSLAVRNQIRESKTHQLKNTIASSEGMISMDSMLIELLKKDCITLDEALLHSFDSELLLKKINP